MTDAIEAVETRLIESPIRAARSQGSGSASKSVRRIIVRIATRDGAEGWGEAAPWAPFGNTAETTLVAIVSTLRPALLGGDPAAIALRMQDCAKAIAGHPEAKAAVPDLIDAAREGPIKEEAVDALVQIGAGGRVVVEGLVPLPRRGAGRVAQEIAAAPERVDQTRPVGLQFPAQVFNVDLQRVRKSVVPVAPDVVVDPRPRQHLAGVAQKVDE